MQESMRLGAKKSVIRGKKAKLTDFRSTSTNASGSGTRSFPSTVSRVSTPPLTEPIPCGTPRFADLANKNLLHPVIVQTIIEDLKFDRMMPVQAATLHDLLEKRIDCLAQAKTGTGKTIAFLLPAIQTLINKKRRPGSRCSLLVISPTRELALQIAKEAKQLLQRLPQYKVCVAIGGTSKNAESNAILSGCDILIGTPGRLFDHLSDSQIIDSLSVLDTLVLDEADRLLDMGFMNDLKKIISCLPDKELSNRQGMLFSATIAPHVQKVAHYVLSNNYKFISTIPKGEINTHERVAQSLITVPDFVDVAPALVGNLQAEMIANGPETFKVIVFAPTAALVDFYDLVLRSLPNMPPVSLLHSRVSQSKRISVTSYFREAKGGILVATDVIARGMDFPAVTNVIQVGIPSDKESYIHRLGRTARAGAKGRGTFIVTEHESFFPTWSLKEIKFEKETADLSWRELISKTVTTMDPDLRKKIYQAWLGYYRNHMKAMRWDNERLVAEGNRFARDVLEAPEPPGLPKSIVSKMGLKGVRGLHVVPDPPRVRQGGGRGGRPGVGR